MIQKLYTPDGVKSFRFSENNEGCTPTKGAVLIVPPEGMVSAAEKDHGEHLPSVVVVFDINRPRGVFLWTGAKVTVLKEDVGLRPAVRVFAEDGFECLRLHGYDNIGQASSSPSSSMRLASSSNRLSLLTIPFELFSRPAERRLTMLLNSLLLMSSVF